MIIRSINKNMFAKLLGVFCILFVAIVFVPVGLYFMIIEQNLTGGIMTILFGPAIAGLDGIIIGYIFSICFNASSRITGGLQIEIQQ